MTTKVTELEVELTENVMFITGKINGKYTVIVKSRHEIKQDLIKKAIKDLSS